MLNVPHERISEFCQRSRISELSLFGSALRDDFDQASDVDVLVEFAAGYRPGLFDLARMQRELEEIFGRKVDLLTRRGVEASRNPYRRDSILSTAKVVYAG